MSRIDKVNIYDEEGQLIKENVAFSGNAENFFLTYLDKNQVAQRKSLNNIFLQSYAISEDSLLDDKGLIPTIPVNDTEGRYIIDFSETSIVHFMARAQAQINALLNENAEFWRGVSEGNEDYVSTEADINDITFYEAGE